MELYFIRMCVFVCGFIIGIAFCNYMDNKDQ